MLLVWEPFKLTATAAVSVGAEIQDPAEEVRAAERWPALVGWCPSVASQPHTTMNFIAAVLHVVPGDPRK